MMYALLLLFAIVIYGSWRLWNSVTALWAEVMLLRVELAQMHNDAKESLRIQQERAKAVEHLKTSEGRELLRSRLKLRLDQ